MLLPEKTLSSSRMFRSVSLITVMSFPVWLAMLTSFFVCLFVCFVFVLFCFLFYQYSLHLTFTCLSLPCCTE